MKTLTFSLVVFFGFLFSAICRADEQAIFELVTGNETLSEGDRLIIVSFDEHYAMGGQRDGKHNRKAVGVTVVDEKIVPSADVSILTLGGSGRYWTLHDSNGFLWPGKRNSGNYLETTQTARDGRLSIQILDDGEAQMDFFSTRKKDIRRIGYNSDYELFTSYTTSYRVKLYRQCRPVITVDIGEAGYSTLYYSKIALLVPAGLEAFTCRLVNERIVRGHVYGPGETIPAGTAVIIRGSRGTYNFETSLQPGTPDAKNQLQGSDDEGLTTGPSDANFYKLSFGADGAEGDLGFYYGALGGKSFINGAHKAYLVISQNAAAKQHYSIDFNTSTGIGAVTGNTVEKAVYDLQGRRVASPCHGIYIINGKKVMIP